MLKRANEQTGRPLRAGEYSYRAVMADRQVVRVAARTFIEAVQEAGRLTGCVSGDDLLSLEIEVGA